MPYLINKDKAVYEHQNQLYFEYIRIRWYTLSLVVLAFFQLWNNCHESFRTESNHSKHRAFLDW